MHYHAFSPHLFRPKDFKRDDSELEPSRLKRLNELRAINSKLLNLLDSLSTLETRSNERAYNLLALALIILTEDEDIIAQLPLAYIDDERAWVRSVIADVEKTIEECTQIENARTRAVEEWEQQQREIKRRMNDNEDKTGS